MLVVSYIGIKKKAEVISIEVVGRRKHLAPKVLQHTAFYYVGLFFMLRGQYDLVPDELVRVTPDHEIYTSKCLQ